VGGGLISEARKRAGLTQSELASRLDVPQSTVARWERATMTPSFDNVVRAVRACGLELEIRLVGRDDGLALLIDEYLRLTPAQRLAQNNHLVDFVEGARHRLRAGSG
jgi:transcriptional regulator with XRE-family HTH domain